MISLIITFLLGLFCCSSININTIEQTKEIEVRENNVKSAYSFLDSIYQFCGGDYLITTFINNYFSYYDTKSFNYITTDRTYLYDDIVLYVCDWGYVTQNRPNNFYSIIAFLEIDYISYSDVDATGVKVFTYDVRFVGYSNSPFTSSNVNMDVTYRVNYIPRRIVINGVQYNDWLLNGSVVIDASYALNANIANRYILFSQQENSDFIFSKLIGLNNDEMTIYNDGYQQGKNDGDAEGYQRGYAQGLNDGGAYDPTALTIFTGAIEIGLLPVNIFLQILNFEIFGINIAGFVTSLLTVSIVIIIFRFLTGNKND